MNTLSQRALDINNVEEALLKIGFEKCLSSPYHPIDNPEGIINLGTSENTICSDLVIPKLESITHISSSELKYFPINGVPEFRAEIGRFLGDQTQSDVEVTIENLTVMNGCSSVFCYLAFVIGDAGDHFLLPVPSYGMVADYMAGYMKMRMIPVEIGEDDSMISVERLEQKYDEAVAEGKKVRALVLINPHNPTGAVYDKKKVLEVLGFASVRNIHVIIDEIYFLSVFEKGSFESCLSYSLEWPDPDRTHFMWSFSKDFAMSGSRCAVLYTKNRAIHSTFNKMGFYHSVPGMVQMKLCAMLQDSHWVEDFLMQSRSRLNEHADIVMKSLDGLGITYLKPIGTLYIWADFNSIFEDPSEAESDTIFLAMLDKLIYIPPAKGFSGTNHNFFRIVYAIPKNYLIEAMRRLDQFVRGYKDNNPSAHQSL